MKMQLLLWMVRGRLAAVWQTMGFTLLLFSLGGLSSASAQVTFTLVSDSEFTENAGYFYNFAWGDYDNDGYVDLIATNGMDAPNMLFRNKGDGTFSRQFEPAIEQDAPATGASPLWGDYDNDGDLDLFISNFAGFGKMVDRYPEIYGGVENLTYDDFYRNEGDGTFVKITEGAWVNGLGDAWGSSSAWADFDLDGHLDLYVGNSHKQANFLFRNNWDGTMTDVRGRVTMGEWETHGLTWTDYNNDGYPDLIIAGQDTMQFRNNGDGTFTPEGLRNHRDLFDAWGIAAGDYDNDGDMDLALAGWNNNRLYNNDGTGVFTEVMDEVINVEDEIESISPSWADYDNDGYLDLHISNHAQNHFLYHNNGDGTFTQVTDSLLVNDGGHCWGTAWGDYDNDGDLDFVGTTSDMYPVLGDSGPIKLFRNDGGTNNWLILSLEGVVSNRSAFGAKVRIKANVNGVDLDQMREVTSGSGCGSQNDLRVHFGLGDAATVDTLRIEWPSGAVQEMSDVVANQILEVVEEFVDPRIGGLGFLPGVEDWFQSDWFGTYGTAFAPWLLHTEHGAIYRDPESTSASMFVYDDAMGAWWWTSEDFYPFIYAYDPPADNTGTDIDSAWLFYFEDSTSPRIFGVLDGLNAGSFLFYGP